MRHSAQPLDKSQQVCCVDVDDVGDVVDVGNGTVFQSLALFRHSMLVDEVFTTDIYTIHSIPMHFIRHHCTITIPSGTVNNGIAQISPSQSHCSSTWTPALSSCVWHASCSYGKRHSAVWKISRACLRIPKSHIVVRWQPITHASPRFSLNQGVRCTTAMHGSSCLPTSVCLTKSCRQGI